MNIEQLFKKREHLQIMEEFNFPYPFPEEYLDFIAKYDIKNIIRRNAKISLKTNKENDYVSLYDFLDEEALIKINKHFYTVDVDDVLIQNGLIIIGETNASSVFICIGISKTNFGQIFIYGWDLGVIKIAENLQLFFDSLQLDEREI